MNPDVKARWVAALRSGEYIQCKGGLHNGVGYCCLGVLAMVEGRLSAGMCDGESKYLSAEFANEVGICPYGGIAPGQATLANMNDEGVPFDEIADVIEEHL